MHILIIGAGPAGSSCAIQLLKAGNCVTLLDREEFPRHAPGETLHPGIEPLLKELDVLSSVLKARYLRHNGIIIDSNTICKHEPYNVEGNWFGFQLYRETFDKTLLDKAISMGANFFSKSSITKVNTNHTGVSSITSSQGELKADFFIDATGKNTLFTKKLKIGYKYDSPKLIAYYGYVHDGSSKDGSFVNPKMIWDDKGWTWISKVKEELITWNRLNINNDKVPVSWLPDELKSYEIIGSRRAADVTWRVSNHVSKHNYFLVGDAAFILDPSSSHGVLKAMMSGMMVAYLIKKVNKKLADKSFLHKYYNEWMLNWYNKDVDRLRILYKKNKFIFLA